MAHRVVVGVLPDGDRVLLCHRCAATIPAEPIVDHGLRWVTAAEARDLPLAAEEYLPLIDEVLGR